MTHRGPFQPLLFCDSVIQPLFMYLFAGSWWGSGSQKLLLIRGGYRAWILA